MTVLGTLRIPGTGRSVAHARRFIHDVVGADNPVVGDAELCTSEVVTNAVAHSASGHGGHVTVTVSIGAGVLLISVVDEGAAGWLPCVHVREDPLAEDGRGLLIVAALADAWGVESDVGTTTWFRLSW